MEITPRWRAVYFYPRPPGGGRQPNNSRSGFAHIISIHDLRVEGDLENGQILLNNWDISIHALRVEGDDTVTIRYPQLGVISIHALRVEGDNNFISSTIMPVAFLSTPSGWRATMDLWAAVLRLMISIHALRVEGDAFGFPPDMSLWDFYPRPPGGGRRLCEACHNKMHPISIHALRVEGDPRSASRRSS